MALLANNPHLTEKVYESGTIGGIDYVDVDFDETAGVIATPSALIPVYNGEYVQVYGCEILKAATATANMVVGILTAAGAEGDADGFIGSVDLDGTAGTLSAAGGALAAAAGYVNVSGATQYVAATFDTAAPATGKVRIFYQKRALPVGS